MKRILSFAALLGLAAAFTPLASQAQTPHHDAGGYVKVQYGYDGGRHVAPPPRFEHRGPGRRGYAWMPGHWERHGHRNVWIGGHWVRVRPGYGDHRMGYGDGHRDSDRDGVPNRYDRDRDGDGVPNRHDRRPDNPRR